MQGTGFQHKNGNGQPQGLDHVRDHHIFCAQAGGLLDGGELACDLLEEIQALLQMGLEVLTWIGPALKGHGPVACIWRGRCECLHSWVAVLGSGLAREMRLHVKRIALVKGFKALEGVGCDLQVLILTKHRAGKSRSLHLQDLVNEHVAKGSDVGFEALASSEHDRLGVSAAIGEFGEMELDALNAFKADGAQIRIVAQVKCFDPV